MKKNTDKRRIMVILFTVYLVVLVTVLFLYRLLERGSLFDSGYGAVNMKPFTEINRFLDAYSTGSISKVVVIANLLGNVLLFVPLSAFLIYFFKPFRNFIVNISVCMGVIIYVETLQYLTNTGSLDIDDIILNTSGCIIFYIIWFLINSIRKVGKK